MGILAPEFCMGAWMRTDNSLYKILTPVFWFYMPRLVLELNCGGHDPYRPNRGREGREGSERSGSRGLFLHTCWNLPLRVFLLSLPATSEVE